MPNHVSHRLFIRGSEADLNNLLSSIAGNDGRKFDFDKLIPMPECIKLTACNDIDDLKNYNEKLAIAYSLDNNLNEEMNKYIIKNTFVTPWSRVIKLSEEAIAEKSFAIMRNAFEETGCIGWYDWSVKNWGTKWDAYEVEINRISKDELELKFDTAWSCPVPILSHVAKLNPSVEISGYAFEEGFYFACEFRSSQVEAGSLDIHFIENDDKRQKEIYKLVFDEDYPEDEDEDEAA